MADSGFTARIQSIEGAFTTRMGGFLDLTLARMPRVGEFLDLDVGQETGHILVVVMVRHHLGDRPSPAVTIYARATRDPFE